MKKIILITLILAILSVSIVSAAENTTDIDDAGLTESEIAADDTLCENATEKQDLKAELEIPDYIVKPNPNDGYPTINVKNIPNDYYGHIYAYVDGNHVADSNDGYFEDTVNLREYDYGKHSVLVMLTESQKYNPLNLTGEFEIVEGYIRIDATINSDEGVYGEFKTGATGYLTVNVDGKLFKKVKIEANEYDLSRAFVSLATLSKGTHSVEAIYSGDANNKKITKTASVDVVYKIPIKIEKPPAYFIEGNYGNAYGSEFNVLTVRLPSDAEYAPIVTIDGTVFDAVKGYANTYTVNTSHLKPGAHSVNVTYPGDGKYSRTSAFEEFKTTAAIGVSIIDGSEYTYNNTIVYLNLPEDAKGNLSVTVDGNQYFTGPAADGAKVYLSDVKIGPHTIEATYTGDDYDIKNVTREIDIAPKVTYPKSMQYSANETFRIEVNPDAKLNITVAFDKKSFTLPLDGGKASFSLSELELVEYEDGTYGSTDILITYQGDYNASRIYSIAVDPIPSRLVGQTSITMYYGDSRTYSLTVWGDHGKIVGAGETVIVRFGNDYLYPKTDAKGVINVKISRVPGTYRITATYKDAQVTGKITVKQVLSLKSVTVKKSAKKLVLQATLKNKNPIKNKQITFKFNGKTYKAKTNSKGIAKVTVKSSVLKKLKVGKTVTYQATYLKDTVKKTAKVKK